MNLIVPVAANNVKYKGGVPNAFSLDSDGLMVCVKAILGLNLDIFDNIYFTILDSHNHLYNLEKTFKLQFERLNIKAKLVKLSNPTRNQAETIYQTIKQENLKGAIYIKDADCFFKANVSTENSVAIFPLEKLCLVNPQHKSYVSIDEMFYITNIIEKRIISHYFCAGGYSFEDAKTFIEYYVKYRENDDLYLSHIIYAMLLDRHIFRPHIVKSYNDYELKFDIIPQYNE